MSKNKRVFNLSTGACPKRRAAERAIENCAAAWVEFGVSIRNLTLAESIAARVEQARLREPLVPAELPHLRYEPAMSGLAAHRSGMKLAWQANEFALGATA